MVKKERLILLLAVCVIVGIGTAMMVIFCRVGIRPSVCKKTLIRKINNVDLVVVYRRDKPTLKISYVGETVREILRAVESSRVDKHMYDTPVTLHAVDFYEKHQKVASIYTCSNLFVFRDTQYRGPDDVLVKHVDEALR